MIFTWKILLADLKIANNDNILCISVTQGEISTVIRLIDVNTPNMDINLSALKSNVKHYRKTSGIERNKFEFILE